MANKTIRQLNGGTALTVPDLTLAIPVQDRSNKTAYIEASKLMPVGDKRKIMSFTEGGVVDPQYLNAGHWSGFPDGEPTTGVWLAAFMPENEVEPKLGFAEVQMEADVDDPIKGNTIPLRTSGDLPGRIKANPAIEENDCITLTQMRIGVRGIIYSSDNAIGVVKFEDNVTTFKYIGSMNGEYTLADGEESDGNKIINVINKSDFNLTIIGHVYDGGVVDNKTISSGFACRLLWDGDEWILI